MPAFPSNVSVPPSSPSSSSSSDNSHGYHSLREDAKHMAKELKRRVSSFFHSKRRPHLHPSAGSGVIKILADGVYHTIHDPIAFSPRPRNTIDAIFPVKTTTRGSIAHGKYPSDCSDSSESSNSSPGTETSLTSDDAEALKSSLLPLVSTLPGEPLVGAKQVVASMPTPLTPAVQPALACEDDAMSARGAQWEDQDSTDSPADMSCIESCITPVENAILSIHNEDYRDMHQRRYPSLASIQSLTAPLETLVLADMDSHVSAAFFEPQQLLVAPLMLGLANEDDQAAMSEERTSYAAVTAPLLHLPTVVDSSTLPPRDLSPSFRHEYSLTVLEPFGPSTLGLESNDTSGPLATASDAELPRLIDSPRSDPVVGTTTLRSEVLNPGAVRRDALHDASDGSPRSSGSAPHAPSLSAVPANAPTPAVGKRPSSPSTARMPGLYRWPTPGPAASVGDIEGRSGSGDEDIHNVYLPVLDVLRMFLPVSNVRFRFLLKFLLMWWLC
ncbi:hypothetical protein BN946_scf184851.g16 [Trametes cinnabarina]|uniref:Uncharacterized protein n=1 Tax=Pycnoporus cinnabarinus TaxID=5643 RepID=A0A060SB64_PYCCI|nr:hypothetical protein BN946_scf184851.g16 [Trametes cinnabarina]